MLWWIIVLAVGILGIIGVAIWEDWRYKRAIKEYEEQILGDRTEYLNQIQELHDEGVKLHNRAQILDLQLTAAKVEKEMIEDALHKAEATLVATTDSLHNAIARNEADQVTNDQLTNECNKLLDQIGQYNVLATALAEDIANLEAQKASLNNDIAALRDEAKRGLTAALALRNESRADGSTCELGPKERKLINLVEEIIAAYPDKDLTLALNKFLWTKIWLPRMQTICRENNVFDTTVRGIYMLTLKYDSGVHYVGQAVDIKTRWYTHAKCMVGVENGTSKLYDDYRPDDFIWTVLESGDIDLDSRERYWIEYYDCLNSGLNSKGGNK